MFAAGVRRRGGGKEGRSEKDEPPAKRHVLDGFALVSLCRLGGQCSDEAVACHRLVGIDGGHRLPVSHERENVQTSILRMKVASRIGHLSRQARHMSGRAEFRDALSQGLASLYAHDMRGAAKSLSESYALLSSANNGADPRGAELDRNPDAAAVLNAIGIMHFRRGDFHKADTLLRESLGIYQRNYETGMGNDAYRDLGGCLNDLVLTCFRLEDYETAEKQLKRCMYMSTRAYNPDKTLVGVTLCNMGRLCLHRGEFADAKTWLVKGCAQLKEAMRNNSLHKEVMGDAQASAALADPKQAKGGEADSNDDILQSSADLGSCLLDLSIVQSRLGNFEAAGKCLRQAADLFNTSAANGGDDTPARNPDYARYLNAMALVSLLLRSLSGQGCSISWLMASLSLSPLLSLTHTPIYAYARTLFVS